MKSWITALAVFTAFTAFSIPAFTAPSPAPSVATSIATTGGNEAAPTGPVSVSVPVKIISPDSVVLSPTDFFSQVMVVIQKFGGAPTMLKIALLITLLVSSMKVSFLNDLVWSKLGVMKQWIAPLLGLLAGILDIAGSGQLSLASVFAYISAGAGAIILHELLDSLKAIPGIGPVWLSLIAIIEKNLGGPATKSTNV